MPMLYLLFLPQSWFSGKWVYLLYDPFLSFGAIFDFHGRLVGRDLCGYSTNLGRINE